MFENHNPNLFQDLFVLELANNHWGSLERGFEIIEKFSEKVRKCGVKAAMKLQIRDVDNFIHYEHKGNKESRYIDKTISTKMTVDQHKMMINKAKECGCIPMATPFDEASVDACVELGCEILKIASSDINDWFLLEKIVQTGKPVMFSTGGASLKQIDDIVGYFNKHGVNYAMNHCVSNYPSEDDELELNQIDFLIKRYPGVVIGHSTHEYHDWHSSMLISYAKGVRTWERHIDIPYPENHRQKEVSKYCSLPEQIEEYFNSFKKAKEMCGLTSESRREISEKEDKYLKALYRGLYVKNNIKKGAIIRKEDLYSAVPYHPGQVTSRNFIEGMVAKSDLKPDVPLQEKDINILTHEIPVCEGDLVDYA